MNIYGKILDIIKKIVVGFISIVVAGLGMLVGPPIFMCMTVGSIGLMFALISIPLGGFLMMQGINIIILKQPYVKSEFIRNGNDTIEAVKTEKYVKLSMIFCFLGSIAYLGLAIYSFIYVAIPENENKGIMIFIGVVSSIAALIFFLLGGKRKVDLKNNVEIEIIG